MSTKESQKRGNCSAITPVLSDVTNTLLGVPCGGPRIAEAAREEVRFDSEVLILVGKWFQDESIIQRLKPKYSDYDDSNYAVGYTGNTDVLSSILSRQGFVLAKIRPDDYNGISKELKSEARNIGNDVLLTGTLDEVQADLCLISTKHFPVPSARIAFFPAEPENETTATHFRHCTRHASHTEITLTLTRVQVTYLIGQQGRRIELLRKETDVTIKIMPIAHRLSPADLKTPARTRQEVRLYGALQNVQHCLSMVEQMLRMASLVSRRKHRR